MANFDFDLTSSGSAAWKPAGLDSLADEMICNTAGWGPINGATLAAFSDVPYAHFDKKERISRVAELATGSSNQYKNNQQFQKFKRDGDTNAEFSYRHDNADDSTFQLVDTAKLQSNNRMGGGNAGGRGGGGRGGGRTNFQQQAISRGQGGQGGQLFGTQSGRGNTGGGRGGRGGRGMRRQDRKDRLSSATVGVDWIVSEEFDLGQLLKLQANPPKPEDLTWAGHLDTYDEQYDKTTTRTSVPLKRVDNKVFYSVTTAEDPILEGYAADGIAEIFATDIILAQVMVAPRSIYSWDLVIQKSGNTIFIDKRENTTIDLLTVSETAHDPPQNADGVDECNYPENLSIEATVINQNFSQHILIKNPDTTQRKTFEPHPFFDASEEGMEGMEPSSVAYRYRKFPMDKDGKLNLCVRSELHAQVTKRGIENLITCHALNEWDSRFSGGINWRQKIDQQRGAVLATELKNNSCKVARWTAQAIISGADQMKIGYISRKKTGEPYEHDILATQWFKPKELAMQMNLSVNNMWGVVKMLMEMLHAKSDGKYVLMKDPNKSTLRLYSVPLCTFEDDDDEETEALFEEEEA